MSIYSLFKILRTVLFVLASLVAVGVAVLASLSSSTIPHELPGEYWQPVVFSLAVGAMTILTLPLILFSSTGQRKGGFHTRVIFELPWTGILLILWLAAGLVLRSQFTKNHCQFADYVSDKNEYIKWGKDVCSRWNVLAVMSFIDAACPAILVFVHSATLLALALGSKSRGKDNVWGSQTRDLE
ncbi:hypothetical protein CPB83DRAFT_850056 [Crepidotus variabilis]|uniref:MARVEL domain-containing protein n=1 Tax=Crepidotus variabilis TaxID=179855 RepID=A0A9P6JSQ9_9AGAR|nr:hypothetical protein CPB83DRAFT_850056 [Crepidotus variabilis]